MFFEPKSVNKTAFRVSSFPSLNEIAFKENGDANNLDSQDISEIIAKYKAFIDEVKEKQLRGVV